jgi:hypothetical protein
MNSYPGQVPPPPSLLGRSAPLNTVGPFELLPGPSGPYADRPACSTGQSGAALGPPSSLLGRSATLDAVGPSELLPGPSDPYADRPTFYVGQSGAVPGLLCGAPIMANTIGQFDVPPYKPDTHMQNLLFHTMHQIIIYHNSNMFRPLHI